MEKELLSFINKYFGVAGTGDTTLNKGQCVGLIEVWLDTLNINDPHLWGNAKHLLANADPTKFEKITNDPTNYDQFPVYGDVLIFGESYGNGLGHCGVVVRANGYTFSLFDQNNPVGSTPTLTNYHNYAGVLGWLHPIITTANPVNATEPTMQPSEPTVQVPKRQIDYVIEFFNKLKGN